jgi:hypothetical protein
MPKVYVATDRFKYGAIFCPQGHTRTKDDGAPRYDDQLKRLADTSSKRPTNFAKHGLNDRSRSCDLLIRRI